MTTGGLRQLMLMDRSRLGDESLDEGLEDSDKDDLGLRGPDESSSWGIEKNNDQRKQCKLSLHS